MPVSATKKKVTRSTQAYERLKHLIHSGHFSAGERLTEAKAAQLLDMPRATIRGPLVRLEAEGLLRGRGSYRSKVVQSIEDLTKVEARFHLRLRRVVFGEAAAEAAKHMTGLQVTELRRLEEVLRERIETYGSDRSKYVEESLKFYRYLVNHCGAPHVLQAWEYNQLQPLPTRSVAFNARLNASGSYGNPALAEIVEAIASHRPEEAENLARARVQNVISAMEEEDWPEAHNE